jgi:hypothetical protein
MAAARVFLRPPPRSGQVAANFVRDAQIITLYKMPMRLLLVDFAALSAMALLQIDCYAGDDVLNDKIVRATLNHSEPAVVKVGINGVTSLEFPYKIEAIDGYGFSQTPGSGDAFQISYTKGSNYFSVRALKPGVTGNLTVVLDQKVYSVFFEESNDPSFVNIFAAAASSGSSVPGEQKFAPESKGAPPAQLAESDPEGLTFSQPPGDYLPTATTIQPAGPDPDPPLAPGQGTAQPLNPAPSPAKRASPKKAAKQSEVARKADPKPEKSPKETVAKTQKPPAKKLFGWL